MPIELLRERFFQESLTYRVSDELNFHGGSDGKKSTSKVGDVDLISRLGRSPGEGNGYPFQDSCLENSMDRKTWWATVHGSQRGGHN